MLGLRVQERLCYVGQRQLYEQRQRLAGEREARAGGPDPGGPDQTHRSSWCPQSWSLEGTVQVLELQSQTPSWG